MVTKILITGATGLLGSSIVKLLADRDCVIYKNSSRTIAGHYRCDLTHHEETKRLMDDINPDVILHCAAIVPKVGADYNNQGMQELNQSMLKNLVNHAHTKHLIFCSSMTVYGSELTMPVKESDVDTASNLSAYALAKLESEAYVRNHCTTATIIRLPGLYSEQRTSGLIYNLLQHFTNDLPITFPSIDSMWSGMHVDDAAKLVIEILLQRKNTNNCEVYNIGYDEELSIDKAVRMFAKLTKMNAPKTIEHTPFRMDLEKMKSLIGNQSTSFENSIKCLLERTP